MFHSVASIPHGLRSSTLAATLFPAIHARRKPFYIAPCTTSGHKPPPWCTFIRPIPSLCPRLQTSIQLTLSRRLLHITSCGSAGCHLSLTTLPATLTWPRQYADLRANITRFCSPTTDRWSL